MKASRRCFIHAKKLVTSIEPSTSLPLFWPSLRLASYSAVMVILLTGGLSVAAKGSHPGDVLYPVKQSLEEVAKPIKKQYRHMTQKPNSTPTGVPTFAPTPTSGPTPEEEKKEHDEPENEKPLSPTIPVVLPTDKPEITPETPGDVTPAALSITLPAMPNQSPPPEVKGEAATSSSQIEDEGVSINIPIINKKITIKDIDKDPKHEKKNNP